MKEILISTLIEAVKGKLISNDAKIQQKTINYVSKDSKDVKGDCLFIPIIGLRFDGHNFIDNFFENGGIISLTENNISAVDGKHYILVDNVKKSLLLLAEYYRNQFPIPLIAVTGSSGKTTTKDMIKSVLSKRYNVLATEGNYNNDIGVPFTLFNLTEEHEVAVIEMGMNQLGEINVLSAVTNPDIGVISNVGVAHIEFLKTRENILSAKLEIFNFMKDTGVAILNRDNDMLARGCDKLGFRKVWCSTKEGADIYAQNIEIKKDFTTVCTITTPIGFIDVCLEFSGVHMVSNALSAVAVGLEMNMDLESIKEGLENIKLSKNRMDIMNLSDETVLINDAYNANPASMKAVIDSMKPLDGRKVGVFGYMGELGEFAKGMHRELGEHIANSDIELAFFIGDCGEDLEAGAKSCGFENIYIFKDEESLKNAVLENIEPKDIILVKGSRSMKLENIVESIIVNIQGVK